MFVLAETESKMWLMWSSRDWSNIISWYIQYLTLMWWDPLATEHFWTILTALLNTCRQQHRSNHGLPWNVENTAQPQLGNGPNAHMVKLWIGDIRLSNLPRQRCRRKVQGRQGQKQLVKSKKVLENLAWSDNLTKQNCTAVVKQQSHLQGAFLGPGQMTKWDGPGAGGGSP